MKYSIVGLKKLLGGRLIGSLKMRSFILETLLCLPSRILQNITKNVWFVSSPEDAWGMTFRGSDISGQHLIFLSHELFEQNEKRIRYTILHEIGHVVLNHRNSMGFKQDETEINKQEREADQFAKKYLLL